MSPKPPIVCIATPSLTHGVAIEYLRSALQTDWELTKRGYDRAYLTHCGDQFIAKARNKLVNDFLVNHPGVENFFFIDDDLGWPAEKFIEFIERDEDVLVGVYPKRSDDEDWPVVVKGEGGVLEERDHLIRVLRGPTGFMRIKRRVLEALQPHAPLFKDINPQGQTEETHAFFAAGVAPDGWFWTEDYIFCNNVVAAGFEIWADPDVEFTHRGSKAWGGTLRSVVPTFVKRAAEAEMTRQAVADLAETASDRGNIIDLKTNRSDAA
jgi:hypothetical protein